MGKGGKKGKGGAKGGNNTTTTDTTTNFPKADPHLNWFYRPHTLSLLFAAVAFLVWLAFSFDESHPDTESRIYYGIIAGTFFFLLFSCMHMPDGIFIRPHPVFWRLVMGLAVAYNVFLAFLLFQSVHDVRAWTKYIDDDLGKPLPMQDYAADCRLFTPDDEDSMFANFKATLFEGFALAHFLGWWMKTLIYRDIFMVTICSILFEIWEYSFDFLLPNFRECWWDHWILDVLGCNLLGMIFGLLTIRLFRMKEYNWATGEESDSYFYRALMQFTPRTFDRYYFDLLSSRRRFLTMLSLLVFTSAVECNVFFLKYLLWLPPKNPMILSRLFLMSFIALPTLREFYHFVSTPDCYKIGTMCWLCVAALTLESLVCFKWGRDEFKDAQVPAGVIIGWVIGILLIATYTLFSLAYRGGGIGMGEKKKKK